MSDFEPPDFGFIAEKTLADADTVIRNIAFFPDISLRDFQQRYSAAGADENQLVEKLSTAMQRVNTELMNPASTDTELDWVSQQQQRGFCSLAAVPALQYGHCSEKIHQYNTAVYAYAKAQLLERADDDEPRSGHLNQPELKKTADEYQQESREALRLLMDKPRCTIELL